LRAVDVAANVAVFKSMESSRELASMDAAELRNLACTMHEGTDFHDHARKFGDVRA
jgi:hypothetical protein